MLKLARQTLRLGVFWVAICASVGGMLGYTKSSLEVLLADYITEQSVKAPAAQPPRVRAQ